jgi:hypothetical protein
MSSRQVSGAPVLGYAHLLGTSWQVLYSARDKHRRIGRAKAPVGRTDGCQGKLV